MRAGLFSFFLQSNAPFKDMLCSFQHFFFWFSLKRWWKGDLKVVRWWIFLSYYLSIIYSVLNDVKTWHLALLSTLVIIFGSIIPLPSISDGREAQSAILGLLHFVSYTICSFLWGRSLKSRKIFFALAAALIPLTEILQLPLPYRSSMLEDLIINSAGTISGALLSTIFKK